MNSFKVPVVMRKATGKNIRKQRLKAKVSLSDLRMVFGFRTTQSIHKWEAGKTLPTLENMVILSKAFGVPIEDIIVIKWVDPATLKRADGLGLKDDPKEPE